MQVDLNRQVTLDDVARTFRAFASWWIRQLESLLPRQIRAWAIESFEQWSVDATQEAWSISSSNPANPKLVLDVAITPDEAKAIIAKEAPQSLFQRVTVTIPAAELLVRTIKIPSSAKSHLRSAVGLQLDRLSPFKSTEVAFDCRVADSEPNSEMNVRVGILPKAALSRYEDKVLSLGCTPRRFVSENEMFTFSPTSFRLTRQQKLQAILLAGALALWSSSYIVAPEMRELELQDLTKKASSLQVEATAAERLRGEIEGIARPAEAIKRRLQEPQAIDTLRGLSSAIPDTTFLSSLSIERGSIRMEGVTTAPKALASALQGWNTQFHVAKLDITQSFNGTGVPFHAVMAPNSQGYKKGVKK